jgi:hypothetical protein
MVATSPFKDGKFVTSFFDITERKQAEEALKRHAAQLNTLRQMALKISSQLELDHLLTALVESALKLSVVPRGLP